MRNDFHNSIAYFCHLCTYGQMTVLECIEKFTIVSNEWQIGLASRISEGLQFFDNIMTMLI